MSQNPVAAPHAVLPSNNLTVEQAQQAILDGINPLVDTEIIAIRHGLGRVLAQAISAPVNVPPERNSAMDGYACRHADIEAGKSLQVLGTSFAGRPFSGIVTSGQCVRIMTGAVVPDGADTVVMQEYVQREGDVINVQLIPKVGEHVRHAGEDLRIGQVVLDKGRKLTAADLGLLASLGIGEVEVIRRLRVAFCSTGDELRSIGQSLEAGNIYDSNSYTLLGMLQKLEVEIIDLGIVRDTPEAVEQVFKQAKAQADVFITSGGVSVGEADYVALTLNRLGSVSFWQLAIKPGKPLTFGRLDNCLFFGLPGNPVSVIVSFALFIRPTLLKLKGENLTVTPEYTALCESPLKKAPGRKEYQRGICRQETDGRWYVTSTGAQGSHILSSMTHANCFIVLPLETGNLEAGTDVTIMPFEALL